MVCVDVAFFERCEDDDAKILLIRRGEDPFKGFWALPGGFVDMDEDLEAAARRELHEETAMAPDEIIQVGAFGDPQRDPRGRNISVVFATVATAPVLPRAGDDAADARFFSLKLLPTLAFDHGLIISSAIDSLKLQKKW